MSREVVDGKFQPIGYEQGTVDATTPAGLTSGKYRSANIAVIAVSGPIRYTLDNDNADLTLSSANGMPWSGAMDLKIVIGNDGKAIDPAKFKFISQTGSVNYYIWYGAA